VNNKEALLEELHVWITFISGNIVKSNYMRDVIFEKYRGTMISQVPLYIHAIVSSKINAVYYANVFEQGNDAANNGGYNLFGVFVTNLYGIYEEFIGKGLLSKQAFDKMIKIEYKEFLVRYIIQVLILGKKGNFKTEKSWNALRKYYGNKPYAYYYLILGFFRSLVSLVYKYIKLSVNKNR